MKRIRHLLTTLLIFAMMFLLIPAASFAAEGQYSGKIIILHTNDVHGSVSGYQYIAGIKKDFVEKGAEKVILVDAGDFTQGKSYVSYSKGTNAVALMNTVGYDLVTFGNHEFDYGYTQLLTNLANLYTNVLASNFSDPNSAYYSNYPIKDHEIIDCGTLKVGFVGVVTPETKTKTNPTYVKDLQFLGGNEMYSCVQDSVDQCRTEEADLVIALAHLGTDVESAPNRSTDLYANVNGLDFIIDGHSHSVITQGPNNEPIQSTGTAAAYVGMIVIDASSKKIENNDLIPITEESPCDAKTKKQADKIISDIDAMLGQKIAETTVALDGVKAHVRSTETNLADLITDAMRWYVLKNSDLKVDDTNVVVVTNGGGIRANLPGKGTDISRQSIFDVMPFGNTLAVIYVKGSELLEALEASSYCTPELVGGFPQIAGMKIKIDLSKKYDSQTDPYPGSTYFGPASINRVTILEIGGKAFDPNETYAVVTNNFCAAGGDTYYAFASATDQFDTGFPLDEVVGEYIINELKGVVGTEYKEPAGRIKLEIEKTALKATAATYNSVKLTWKKVEDAEGYEISKATSKAGTFKPMKTITNASTTSFSDLSLATGKTYYYKIKAYTTVADQKVYSGFSNTASAKPVLKATTLTAKKTGSRKIRLTWKKVAGASGYVITRCMKKNGTFKTIKTITKGSILKFINTKLKARKTYYYKIKAYRKVNGKKVYGPLSKVKYAKAAK